MKSFGKLLKEYINESPLSVNRFAQEIDFDRGYLNNVFINKRTLPIEKLNDILSITYFSDVQKEQLRTAFFYEHFGKAKYEQVCAIIKHMQSDYCTTFDMNNVFDSNINLSKTIQITSQNNLLEIIQHIISDTNIEQIYTNFSFLHKQIDSIVYTSIQNRNIENYHHFTTFKIDDHSTYNIEYFFDAIKYIKKRLDIRFSYDSVPNKTVQSIPFPYFFITSIGLLQYDENAENGFWIPSNEYPINFDRFVDQLFSDHTPIAIYSSSPLELQSNISNFSQMESSITAIDGGAPCLAHYLDKEDFDLLANPNLENREALIQIAVDYFSFPIEFKSICTYKGLRDFALTGKLPDLPTSLIQILPTETRVKIFDLMIKQVSEKPESIRILNESKITLPSDIVVDFYHGTSSTVLGGIMSESFENQYYGEFLIPLQETSIRNSFMNFLKYIEHGNFTYSPSYTLKMLEQLKILAASSK